jgi:hypothetical protein
MMRDSKPPFKFDFKTQLQKALKSDNTGDVYKKETGI